MVSAGLGHAAGNGKRSRGWVVQLRARKTDAGWGFAADNEDFAAGEQRGAC